MRSIMTAVLASLLLAAPIAARDAAAQSALQVPQSIRLQHEQIVSRLASLAKGKGPVAAAAQKAVNVLKDHYAKEEQFVLPPLGLLPRLAKGEVSKDMEPAIAMAERTKAGLAEFQNDHIQLTSLMNEMIAVGKNRPSEGMDRPERPNPAAGAPQSQCSPERHRLRPGARSLVRDRKAMAADIRDQVAAEIAPEKTFRTPIMMGAATSGMAGAAPSPRSSPRGGPRAPKLSRTLLRN